MSASTIAPPALGQSNRLPSGPLQQLHEAILEAFNLNELRQLVRFSLDKRLEVLVNTQAGLSDVTFDLLEEIERAGWTEQFIRAVYNARPQNPLVRAFCDTQATFVYQPPPTALQLRESVSAGLSALPDLVRGPAGKHLRELIRQLCGRFDQYRQRILQMGRYKELHEDLHTINYSLSDELHRSVSLFRANPAAFRNNVTEFRLLRRYRRDLMHLARDAAAIIDRAPPLPFREVEDAWVNHLNVAAECLLEGLEQGNPEVADQGLHLVNWVLNQQPTRINSEIIRLAADLYLRQLSDDLRKLDNLLAGDKPQTGLFSQGLRDAQALHPRLSSLLAEHGHWQTMDNNLALVCQTPRLLPTMWPILRTAGLEIANLQQTAEWAGGIQEAIERYDRATDPGTRDFALDDLKGEVGARFYNVDKELRALCNTLEGIAVALDAVLEAISHVDD